MLRLLTFLSAIFLASAAAATTLWVDAPRDGFLNLRAGPATKYYVINKMPHGSKVEVLATPGKWYKVRHETGAVGWAHSHFLSAQPVWGHDGNGNGHVWTPDNGHARGQSYWVDAERFGFLNLRTGPSRHDPVIAKMPHGTEVRVFRKEGNWYKLRHNGQVGWANQRFLSEHRVDTGYGHADPYWVDSPSFGFVFLRSGPSRQDPVIDRIDHGTKVGVLAKDGNWYKLRHNGQVGWANQRFLSDRKVTTGHGSGHGADHGKPDGQTYWVYAPGYGGLNLRVGPGTSYGIIMTMNQRDKVTELGRQGDWFLLRHGSGATGWAHGDFLVKQDPGFVPNHKNGKNDGWKDKRKDRDTGKRKDAPNADDLAAALFYCAGRSGQAFDQCFLDRLGYVPQGVRPD